MDPSNFIDLCSPEPEMRPKPKKVIDLTGEPEVPVRNPSSNKATAGRPNRPSLSGSTPSAPSSFKATPSRPQASSLSRSTPSASSNVAMSSLRLNLGERITASPAIKESPKSSQRTQKDTSAPAPKPRFRAPSPVPDGHPSSNFLNIPGLEREKESLSTPTLKKPQLECPRPAPRPNGVRPGTSQAKSVGKQPQPKETRPESSQSKPEITQPQSKEARLESSQSKPEITQPQRKSLAPEPEHPKRRSLPPRPKSKLSQPASQAPTPLSNVVSQSFDDAIDRQLLYCGSTSREVSRGKSASVVGGSAGDSSSRRDSPSKSSSRVRTHVDSYNLKILSGTALHTPAKYVKSADVSRRNSVSANDSPAQLDAGIEELLRSFKEDMETTHAFNVHFLLEDASKTASKAQVESRFIDKVSPFASMKSIEKSLPPTKAPNVHSFKTVTSDKKSKNSPATSYTMSKILMPDYVPIPRYTSLTFVHRNILSPDDEKLRSMPQENEQTKKGKALEEELKKAYSGQRNETSCEKEYRNRLHGNIDFWLEEGNIQCTKGDLEKYLITREDFGTHVEKTQKGLERAYKKAAPLIAKLKTHLNAEICKICGGFNIAFEKVFDISLGDILLPVSRIKEMLELELTKPSRISLDHQEPISTKGPMFAVETYTNLSCLICGALECQTHGEYSEIINHNEDSENDEDNEEEDEKKKPVFLTRPERITLQAHDLLRKHLERQARMKENGSGNDTKRSRAPCSLDCHLVVGAGGEVSRPLTEGDINDISLLLISLSYKTGRCCDIAFSLSIPCFQVFREIDRQERENMQIDLSPPTPLSKAEIERHRPSWYDNRKRVLKGEWREMTTVHLQEEMTQANPCHHTGPCSKATNCECFRRSILCEDMCSCSDDCPRRFTGCSCHSNGKCCERDTCICIQLNRECGPCCLCGALERLNPANRYNDDLFAKGCQNVVIQRGVPKATIAGISQIAGHGLYAGEFIAKNSYIDEYVGELISGGEAERRGIIYDHNSVSFLFNLNREWVLDGYYLSNKTRYINHASHADNGLNCKAIPLWVNGEHRIKFVAVRDIDAGEELLFDYGKLFSESHGLNKKLPKTNSLSKKAAAVTDLESGGRSDGIRPRRGGMSSRGTHGTAGRAKKHGQKMRSMVLEDEEEDPEEAERQRMLLEEAEDDEDDYEDVGAADGRRRCVCRYPGCGKPYTRIDNMRTHQRRDHGMDV